MWAEVLAVPYLYSLPVLLRNHHRFNGSTLKSTCLLTDLLLQQDRQGREGGEFSRRALLLG